MKELWRRGKNKWLITNMDHYLEGPCKDRPPAQSFERALAGMVCFVAAVVAVVATVLAAVVMILFD